MNIDLVLKDLAMGIILFHIPKASCSVFSPAFVEVLNCIVLAEQEEPSRKPGPKSLEVDFSLSLFFFAQFSFRLSFPKNFWTLCYKNVSSFPPQILHSVG